MPSTTNYKFGDVVLVSFPFTRRVLDRSEWTQAGLLKLSAFKPLIATIDQAVVLRMMGTLAARDRASLEGLLRTMLGPP